MEKSKELLERVSRFLEEMGTPVTKFCKRVGISTPAYYAWRNGTLTLSEPTLQRIDDYLQKYNF